MNFKIFFHLFFLQASSMSHFVIAQLLFFQLELRFRNNSFPNATHTCFFSFNKYLTLSFLIERRSEWLKKLLVIILKKIPRLMFSDFVEKPCLFALYFCFRNPVSHIFLKFWQCTEKSFSLLKLRRRILSTN